MEVDELDPCVSNCSSHIPNEKLETTRQVVIETVNESLHAYKL
jgi:hypothetical protein